MPFLIAIAVLILLIVIIKSNKSKNKINEAKENDDKIKRQLELEILKKEAESKGIDTSKFDDMIAKEKAADSDAATKYLPKK